MSLLFSLLFSHLVSIIFLSVFILSHLSSSLFSSSIPTKFHPLSSLCIIPLFLFPHSPPLSLSLLIILSPYLRTTLSFFSLLFHLLFLTPSFVLISPFLFFPSFSSSFHSSSVLSIPFPRLLFPHRFFSRLSLPVLFQDAHASHLMHFTPLPPETTCQGLQASSCISACCITLSVGPSVQPICLVLRA